jgi:hypothetical protein
LASRSFKRQLLLIKSRQLLLPTGESPGRALALRRAVALKVAFNLEERVVAVASEASRQFFG